MLISRLVCMGDWSVWYWGAAFYVCFYIYLWRVFWAIENFLGIERQVYGNLQRVGNVPTVGPKQLLQMFPSDPMSQLHIQSSYSPSSNAYLPTPSRLKPPSEVHPTPSAGEWPEALCTSVVGSRLPRVYAFVPPNDLVFDYCIRYFSYKQQPTNLESYKNYMRPEGINPRNQFFGNICFFRTSFLLWKVIVFHFLKWDRALWICISLTLSLR